MTKRRSWDPKALRFVTDYPSKQVCQVAGDGAGKIMQVEVAWATRRSRAS